MNKTFNESREIQVRVAQSELSKAKDIRVLMAPSDAYPDNLGAISFQQYGMNCQPK
ncbi:MAG: hypothetical protein H7256_15680 [Bdellovibrio sp.]|nr:hypothetical protein [Bdellovibrio sp.]